MNDKQQLYKHLDAMTRDDLINIIMEHIPWQESYDVIFDDCEFETVGDLLDAVDAKETVDKAINKANNKTKDVK